MYSMFPVSKRAHSQGETLDDIQANLREASEMLLEDENRALNRPSIHYEIHLSTIALLVFTLNYSSFFSCEDSSEY
ncbi:hypothetical protein QUA42_03870 [Microcoleus sp. Pol11C2]|uniref:hypothetical protein n=1 Tax=Microcoleus sp. Pol11C2 TaxID=3055389 RepID=UPI002FD45FB2